MSSELHRFRAPLWVWVLTLVLLALLVWLVGQRVQERPHLEIGVTGGEELPVDPTPTPAATAVERAAGSGEPPERSSPEESGSDGGEAVTSPEIPTSPEPRR